MSAASEARGSVPVSELTSFWRLPSIRYARRGLPDWPAIQVLALRANNARRAQYRAGRLGSIGMSAGRGGRRRLALAAGAVVMPGGDVKPWGTASYDHFEAD